MHSLEEKEGALTRGRQRGDASPHFRIREAFTLVELLVVIAAVAILAGLLLPVLSGAKWRAHAIRCMSNERQLALAWHVYADDHNGRLPRNFGIVETQDTVNNRTYLNWVNNVLSWELDSDNTNTALLFAGGIGPYLGAATEVYRCPTDFVLSDRQRDAGWRSRVRSYSMNAMVGDAGEFTVGGTNVNNPHYRQFYSITEMPQPSDIFVFVEEHPHSLRDGYFLNNPYVSEWNDLPASYHNGAANLAFADGHVETHRWVDGSTRHPARAYSVILPLALDKATPRTDFKWLMQRTSTKLH
ncbi:MAG: prepilin-type N-terminal cleavage/methylation domain-containing protein [Verrucomicrobia subdivision 3 bacterium]|nr:prepilin-type N-terminal cleavage/methylation domain-containing protein [Limisphaerales bacterium]